MNISEVYNFKNRFLTLQEIEKLDLKKYFSIVDNHEADVTNFYSRECTDTDQCYCGLEFMIENSCYDLFSWSATQREKDIYTAFQSHCNEILLFTPICNNF